MEKKTEEQLSAELSELRAKNTKVREFIIPIDEDDETQTVTLFLKPVNKMVRQLVEKTAKTNVEKAVYDGLKMLQLGGDSLELITNNDYAMVVAEQGLVKYMSVADVIIKKN
jgi:hypothetical protein